MSAPATTVRPTAEALTAWLLLLLSRGEAHGYGLRAQLTGRGLDVDAPVMYRRLRRLEQRGLVKSSWGVSAIGPRRRSYTITRSGRVELGRQRAGVGRMNHLPQGVDVTTRVDLDLHAALRHRALTDKVSEQVVQRRAMARYVWPVDHVDREGHWPADVMRDGGGW